MQVLAVCPSRLPLLEAVPPAQGPVPTSGCVLRRQGLRHLGGDSPWEAPVGPFASPRLLWVQLLGGSGFWESGGFWVEPGVPRGCGEPLTRTPPIVLSGPLGCCLGP